MALRLTSIALLMVLSSTTLATGDQSRMALTGADFLEACSRTDPDWISFCHGYVQAVFDGVRREGEAICLPSGTTRAKLVGLVVWRLNETPELQELNAASVVYAVALKSYPCG